MTDIEYAKAKAKRWYLYAGIIGALWFTAMIFVGIHSIGDGIAAVIGIIGMFVGIERGNYYFKLSQQKWDDE